MSSLSLTPAQWQAAWGADRLVFPGDQDIPLPDEALRFLRSYGLPRRVIFEGAFSFEIYFDRLLGNLTPYSQQIDWGDCYDLRLDRAWAHQLVIGEEEFCNGHATYCVHHTEGTLTRLDVELPQPEVVVNSSLPRFGASLLQAVNWSAASRQASARTWKASLSALATAIQALDPEVFHNNRSFWPTIIRRIQNLEPGSYEITSDPTRSRPRF